MFIDTHTHIYLKSYDKPNATIVQQAIDKEVIKMFMPNIDSQSINDMYELNQLFPNNCYLMMGIHPCSIQKDTIEKELTIAKKELFNNPSKFIGVGEIGLDYYWSTQYVEEQQDALKTQLQWAKQLNLPVSLHSRNAFADVYKIVKGQKNSFLSGVFHCFSDGIEEAQQILELSDFYLGIGGVITYKNGKNLVEVIQKIGINKIVLETDSPYLSPEPLRKYKNESANITLIAEKIAQILQINIQEVQETCTQNALNLFKLHK